MGSGGIPSSGGGNTGRFIVVLKYVVCPNDFSSGLVVLYIIHKVDGVCTVEISTVRHEPLLRSNDGTQTRRYSFNTGVTRKCAER